MYRFLLRPSWIGFHLLVAAAIVVMVNLGFWQLDRLDERREFNAQVVARIDAAPVPITDLVATASPDELEWRQTTAQGTYLPDEQVVVVNRSQNGRAGDNIVTPMRLADGRILLVNRGFVPIGLDTPPAPDGLVAVEGLVRTSQERRTGQLGDPSSGRLTEVQRIDIDRLAPQLPGDVLPVYVDVLTSSPPELPGLPEPVIRPDLSEGPHLSYAVQWFIFSASVAVGWVLAVRWSIARRRHAAATVASPVTVASGGSASAVSPTSAVDEPTTATHGTPRA